MNLGPSLCKNQEWLDITKDYTAKLWHPWLRLVAHLFIPECRAVRAQVVKAIQLYCWLGWISELGDPVGGAALRGERAGPLDPPAPATQVAKAHNIIKPVFDRRRASNTIKQEAGEAMSKKADTIGWLDNAAK
ncbi:hypothetical protein ColTof4_03019 [Colletotrichum tofieldiae]|nr:hypothetical protein ColTof4_03019 [Colletotrichum tofieldiae]